jgi:6-hydroxy-3-succinoylpyridine 3-monooxygenase
VWLDHLVCGGKSRRKPVFSRLGGEMAPTVTGQPLRTRVYVDGYNLYYGCLKGTPYKWLDLLKLFEQQILPSILIPGTARTSLLLPTAIKFFTADILGILFLVGIEGEDRQCRGSNNLAARLPGNPDLEA